MEILFFYESKLILLSRRYREDLNCKILINSNDPIKRKIFPHYIISLLSWTKGEFAFFSIFASFMRRTFQCLLDPANLPILRFYS